MSVLKNLGYIADATYYPCVQPNPVLIVKAAGHAGIITLWEAATFGCIDIMRLRAGISPWHSRGLKALIRGINPPEVQKSVNGLYKFVIPAEKLLFTWFIVDLTTGFFANWQSMIFKLNACNNGDPGCTYSGPLATWVEPTPNAYVPIFYHFSSDKTECRQAAGSSFGVPANHYFSVTFSMTVEPVFTGIYPSVVTTKLQQLNGAQHSFESEPITAPWNGNNIHTSQMLNFDHKYNSFREYRFFAKADTPCKGKSGHAYVTISPFPILNQGIIPINCFGPYSPSDLPPLQNPFP